MDSQSTNHPTGDAQQAGTVAPATRPIRARLNPLTTLVIGLVVGTLVGYVGRPLVTARPLNSAVTPAGAANPAITGKVAPSTTMDAVVVQTRHFKGNANAPVTIIEFGDFQ